MIRIKEIYIKNFRSIDNEGVTFQLKDLSILIGNNGTSKTTLLEAINFCLSPHFLSNRIGHSDFYNGTDDNIEIKIIFDSEFDAFLPDGYQKQTVKCNGINLQVKKRDRASSGKAFSDSVVISHYALPVANKSNQSGWEIARKSGKTRFKFDERLLSFPLETKGLPKSFYFSKDRDKQLQKGFNSSMSSVFDDLNWRFSKNIRTKKKNGDSGFLTKKRDVESEIISNTDDPTIKKVFSSLNEKLENLGIDKTKLVFLDSYAPYASAFLSGDLSFDLDLPVSELGSGIEMIISLLFLETLASLSKEKIILLIDEPELHLHPTLQDKLIHYLIDISSDTQVIISTHSPFFFKNSQSCSNVELLVTTKENQKVSILNSTNSHKNLFPWSPSWGEINYYAYGLPTIEFHNELYGYVQEKENKHTEKDLESYFSTKQLVKSKKWAKMKNGFVQPAYDVTLPTFIRNSIHHPENKNNGTYTASELKDSIEELISIL